MDQPGSDMESNHTPLKTVEEPTRASLDTSVRRDRARTISGMSPFAGTQGIAGMIAQEALLKKRPSGGIAMPGIGLQPLKKSNDSSNTATVSGPTIPDVTFTLEELKKIPEGVEKARIVVSEIWNNMEQGKIFILIQEWLKPDEFVSVMGVTREKYFSMANWQQSRLKKKAGL